MSFIILNGLTWISVPGSRSSLVNMEARPMTSDMLTRRCVVTRLSDLTIERFKEAVQSLGAGAMLILLPKNTSVSSLEQMEVKKLKCNNWLMNRIAIPKFTTVLSFVRY